MSETLTKSRNNESKVKFDLVMMPIFLILYGPVKRKPDFKFFSTLNLILFEKREISSMNRYNSYVNGLVANTGKAEYNSINFYQIFSKDISLCNPYEKNICPFSFP